MFKRKTFGEALNVRAAPGGAAYRDQIENNPNIDVISFDSGNWASMGGPDDFYELFSGISLHENTRHLDVSMLNDNWNLTQEVCESIPPQITTLEISLCTEDYENGRRIFKYELNPNLLHAPNISRLIIKYPSYISKLNDFKPFLQDLNELTKNHPTLQQVYLYTYDERRTSVSETEANYTREQMLVNISSQDVQFYLSTCVSDTLVPIHSIEISNFLACFEAFSQEKNIPSIPLALLFDILLYAQATQKPQETWKALVQAEHDAELAKRYPPETGRLLREHGLFTSHLEAFLQDNRHKNADMQHEYDKRFGLVSVGPN